MSQKTLCLVATVLFAGTFSLAAVHSGLKDAIDNHDIQKAAKLVKNMHITDIYCPGTLSWADAQEVYGDFFIENPKKMATLCDADFISAYDKIACTNKNEISLCMERMRTLPTSEWQTYLTRIQENKLHLGTGTYRTTETTKEKMSSSEKKECSNALKAQKMLITQYTNELKKETDQDANFPSTAAGTKLQSSIDSLNTLVASNEKNCLAGVKDVEKVVTKKITKNPLSPALHVLYKYLEGIINQPFGFDDKNKQLLASYRHLAGNETEFSEENVYVEKIAKAYSESADIESSLILESCRLYPQIDKKIQMQFEVELFSCKEATEKYDVECNQWAKELKIEVASSIRGGNSISYKCDGVNWVALSAMEGELGSCDKERKNSKKIHENNYYGCNGKKWEKLPSEIEYATYGKPCNKSSEDKTIKNVKKNVAFVCKSGKWRYRMIGKNQELVQSRQVGNRIWNVEYVDLNIPNSFCPAGGNKEKKCPEYSRLYLYDAAKEVCPDGWSLPTMDDVNNLNETMANRVQGSKTHFGKYPGAFRDDKGVDKQFENVNYFWLKDDEDGLLAGKAFVKDSVEKAAPIAVEEASWGLPVRCVKE